MTSPYIQILIDRSRNYSPMIRIPANASDKMSMCILDRSHAFTLLMKRLSVCVNHRIDRIESIITTLTSIIRKVLSSPQERRYFPEG